MIMEGVKLFDFGDAVSRLRTAIDFAFEKCPDGDSKKIQKLHDLLDKRMNSLIVEVERLYR